MEVMKGYKQTSLGIFPMDWSIEEVNKLGTINGRVGWKGYTKKDLIDSGPYAIGAKHIDQQNRLDLRNPTCLTYEKFLESPEIMVLKGDLLIVQRGTIGKVVHIDVEIGDATINPSMLILRLKDLPPKFVFYYLTSKSGQDQILDDTSSTGVPMITQKQVLSFKIPLPPTKAEQTAIATALSDTDALITNLEKLIEKKREIKLGAMQELLKPKEGWVVKKLVEIANVTMGQSPLSRYYNNQGIGLPLIQGNADVKDRQTIIRAFTSYITKRGFGGDVIMSVRAPVGEISKTAFDCCLGRGVCAIKSKNDYLYHYLIYFEKSWAKLSTGSTFDSVNSKQVKELEIPIPSHTEQVRISHILTDMDTEISALKEKLSKYKLLKQGMMQELLTGKTRLV